MSLLQNIQKNLLEDKDISPILLKLRFLASRLGSDVLEDWVKHEADGYPPSADLPQYRKLEVRYMGDFRGPRGSGIKNFVIPPALIKEFGGEGWNEYGIRQSVSGIDHLVGSNDDSSLLEINAADLTLLLQDKVFPGYSCIAVTGHVSKAELVGLRSTVRARALELTIELEKKIPAAAEIKIGLLSNSHDGGESDRVTQITNQTIYGNYTKILSSGSGASINVNVTAGDIGAVQSALEAAGISADDAKEFVEIIASEQPENSDEPFGGKAKQWIANNIPKALSGTWKVSSAVAMQLLTEAALKFYGLK